MLRRISSSGLTLVELLFGLALLAVLGGLAVPSFQSQVASSQLTAATNNLLGAMMLARSQAMRLGQRVTICRSNDQQTCDNNSTRGWETGWITFTDLVRSGGAAAVDSGEMVDFRAAALSAQLMARGNQGVDDFVSFAANGSSRSLTGSGMVMGTIRVCSKAASLKDADRARDLVLSAQGRFVVRRPATPVDATCPTP